MSKALWGRRSFLWTSMGWLACGPTAVPANVEPGRFLPRVKIALAAGQSLYHLPLTLADQLGFFKQAGVAVEWVAHESGAKALGSVLQGQADVLSGSFEHLFFLQQKAQGLQAFVQTGRTPQLSLGVSTRPGLVWRSVMDLRGLRVGVSSLDSATHWMACHWLMNHGLLPEDVVFVPVGSAPQVVESLRSGAIDALCQPDPVMHWLEQKNEIRVVFEARSLAATRKLFGGMVPGACLMTTADFLQRQPERVQALSDAVVHALKWLQTAGLTDVLKAVPAGHWLGDRAIYLGAFEKLRESYAVDGILRSDEVRNAWRAHARLPSGSGLVRVMPEKTYTNAFALKSRVRFSA